MNTAVIVLFCKHVDTITIFRITFYIIIALAMPASFDEKIETNNSAVAEANG